MARKPSTGRDAIVRVIEQTAATESRAVRAAHEATMAAHRKVFAAARLKAEAIEREALKAIERRRITTIAAVDGHPVRIADIASVRRETADGDISVARVALLDGPDARSRTRDRKSMSDTP